MTSTITYESRVDGSTTLVCGVTLDTWPRAVVPSDDDGVTLSQTVVVVLGGFTWARLRDARFAADGMLGAFILLQYTL